MDSQAVVYGLYRNAARTMPWGIVRGNRYREQELDWNKPYRSMDALLRKRPLFRRCRIQFCHNNLLMALARKGTGRPERCGRGFVSAGVTVVNASRLGTNVSGIAHRAGTSFRRESTVK